MKTSGLFCGGLSVPGFAVLIEPFPSAHQQQVLPGDFSLPGGCGCDATGRFPRLAPETLSCVQGAQNPTRAQLVFSLCRCICASDLSTLVLSTCCLSFFSKLHFSQGIRAFPAGLCLGSPSSCCCRQEERVPATKGSFVPLLGSLHAL